MKREHSEAGACVVSAGPQQWEESAKLLVALHGGKDPVRWMTLAMLALHVAEHGVPPDYWDVLRSLS